MSHVQSLQHSTSPIPRPQPLHQPSELGEAGRDHGRVVDGDRLFGRKPHGQEGHGDAVIEVRGHRATAGHLAVYRA